MTHPIKAALHQNGFIKVQLPLGGRLHIWSPFNPKAPPGPQVHDHPFAFRSEVVAGEMINTALTAREDPDGDHIEYAVPCATSFGPQEPPKPTGRRFTLVEHGPRTLHRGDFYTEKPGDLHRTDAVFALTVFVKGEQVEGMHSHLYGPADLPNPLPPFVQPPAADLEAAVKKALDAAHLTMEYICDVEADIRERPDQPTVDQLLKSMPLLSRPGYHMRLLPRGEYGLASGVVEEALELAEATEQRNPLMALQEAADVYGALSAWLDDHHPDLNMKTLERMAEATARAFHSGLRTRRS